MGTSPDHEQLKRRNRELSILNTIAEALNREVDLSQALHTTLAHVADLCDLQTGWIWLMDEETGEAYLAAVQHLPPIVTQTPGLMDGTAYCYCLDVYQSGDMDDAANINVIGCSRLAKLVRHQADLRYHACIPLYAHGKKMGLLNVASADWRELSPDDLRLLYTVGDLLSMAIERARLFEKSARFGATEERNRLAREIHDTLAQGLAGIALKLETVDALLETDPDRAKQIVQQALSLTRHNLDEARRSVLDLRAAPLEGRTLAEAVRFLADDLIVGANLKLNFVMGEMRPLPLRVETGLFRVAQEALNNIVKHAEASEVWIHLKTTPGQVQLVIGDDGKGFDPEQIPEGCYGIIGLNERVRLLGGTAEFCSGDGEGTEITVIVPIEVQS